MKKLILVTNDDGIDSPGLKAAAEAVIGLGDVICVAPQTQQTAMGRAFPKHSRNGAVTTRPFRIGDAVVPAFGVEGSPALVVSHAVLELCDRTPSLCVSGINYGENLGLSIFASGTLGAAFEAHCYDIPALAVSIGSSVAEHRSSDFKSVNWTAAKHFTSKFASELLVKRPPSHFAVLNVNVPRNAKSTTPFEITRQSRQRYYEFSRPDERSLADPYGLHVGIEVDKATLEQDSDIACFCQRRHVSVTPLTWDLTCKLKSLHSPARDGRQRSR